MSPPPLSTAPLPLESLTPQVLRIIGPQAPASMRQMAARGLAPLPPSDLCLCLYQLATSDDKALAQLATESAGRLPEPVLRGALSTSLPAVVLDFLGRRLFANPLAVSLLLANRAVHDRTVEHLATLASEAELEEIAKNEERLLRAPAIIAALYMNPRARASTAMRAVELAAHNNVTVDIPGFEDVVAALRGVAISADDDQRFAEVVTSDAATGEDGPAEAAAAESEVERLGQEEIERTQQEEEAAVKADGEAEQKKKRFEDLPIPLQIRAATLGTAFERSVAVRSTIRMVSMAAVRSPALTLPEVIKFAANRALNEDIIRFISNRREWTQLNSVRLSLINNNKTPLATSMRLLNFVHNRDLKSITRSKNVPGPLVKAAKELLAKRERRT